MFIGIDKRNWIRQIADTVEGITGTSLTAIEVGREAVFGNWTNRRILAYCYKPLDGAYSLYPARDLTQIELADNKEATQKLSASVDKTNEVQKIVFVASAESGQIDEQVAVKHKDMFEDWEEGKHYKVGNMRNYGEEGSEKYLYKCGQEHDSLAVYPPPLIPSIWTVINVLHEGTLEDPIPAVRNMEYVKGLYYIENETIYLMSRDGMADGEKITLAYVPSELVDSYFTVVEVTE